ncbi:MAG: sarcosine oxidase subunit gamma [Pseudomonadota bacterium]
MAKLIPNTACAGLLPVTIGSVTITEVETEQMTLIAPFHDQTKATSVALKAAFGFGFPSPNRTFGAGPRIIWCGRNQALLLGAEPPDLPAQCVDQSDAFAVVRIDGEDAEAVLARLVPIDLRRGAFKRGHTARTMLAHMQVGLTRIGASAFEIMAFRSMAGTLVHDLNEAATSVAGRRMVID